MFLSDLAVLLFSTVLMQMCTLLYCWANKNDDDDNDDDDDDDEVYSLALK